MDQLLNSPMNGTSSIAKTKRIRPMNNEISIPDTINYSNMIFHFENIIDTKDDSFCRNILHLVSENSTNISDFAIFSQQIVLYFSDKEHYISMINLFRYFNRNGKNSNATYILKQYLAAIAQRSGLITRKTEKNQNVIFCNFLKELRITEGIKNKDPSNCN